MRSLPSRQMFEHVLKRHNVLFVYIGGESPLKVSLGIFAHTHIKIFKINISHNTKYKNDYREEAANQTVYSPG